ncbi:hypothetical protein AB1K32_13335 [Metabacillus dongyingensis]|uniref:hypothetical protein n=1 Tax=Metabacillus dongyingensis TaxID=2874282 RepID=UPI003B8BC5D4
MIRSSSEITPETRVIDLEGWRLESPSEREAKRRFVKHEGLSLKQKEFVFMRRDFLNETKEGLSLGEVGLLLFLARYMKLGDEGKLTHKGKRLSITEIAKLIGKTDRQVRTIITELEKRSLLFKVKEGRSVYVDLSEDLFVCGSLNGKDNDTVKVFKVKLAEVAKKLSLNELGLFMLMLNHMHWKTHVLCDNPDEKETEQLILWRRKDLCEALGASRNFVNATLRKLRELKAIAEVKTVNEGIVLHPSIVSRQRVASWDSIVNAIDNGLTKDNYK